MDGFIFGRICIVKKNLLKFLNKFFWVFFSFPVLAKATFWQTLYGFQPSNSINMGAVAYHVGDADSYDYLYPLIGVTIHSVNLTYFKNSFHRSTYAVSMERTLYRRTLSSNFQFNTNYDVGLFFAGYCTCASS